MHDVDVVRRLHEHRAWVNQNLMNTAAQLDPGALRRQFDIGQGSVWKSLLHMWGAEFVWLEALIGQEQPSVPGDDPAKIPGNQEGAGAINSLDELRSKWSQLEGRWQTHLNRLVADELNQVIFKVAFSTGKRHATRRGDVLLHVATHAHYTAAQVVNMLRQLGVERLPEVMMISMVRQQSVLP